MRYTWIDEYLLGKAGVTKDLQKDWNWIRYQIGGKTGYSMNKVHWNSIKAMEKFRMIY